MGACLLGMPALASAQTVTQATQATPADPADPAEPLIESLAIGRARLELQFAPGFDAELQAEARAWVRRSAVAAAAYFGSFPVPQAELLLMPVLKNYLKK